MQNSQHFLHVLYLSAHFRVGLHVPFTYCAFSQVVKIMCEEFTGQSRAVNKCSLIQLLCLLSLLDYDVSQASINQQAK